MKVRLPAFELKRCSACCEVKFLADFVRNRSARGGFGSYCKRCHNTISKRNRARRHGSSRNYLIRHRYGVEPQYVDAALEKQGGLCAICRRVEARHLDHDHETGAPRGMLCFSCNGALGQFNDDPERLSKAMGYLKEAGELHATIGAPGTDKLMLCVVCRVWLPRTRFEDDWRRHRRKKQWCQSCGDKRGYAAIDALNVGARRYHLLTKYGIDAHEVDELVEDQAGLCAICRSSAADQVDHDHETRFVRGILCGGCNAGLGQLKEDPEIMLRAIEYLTSWQARPDTVQEPAVPYILSVA